MSPFRLPTLGAFASKVESLCDRLRGKSKSKRSRQGHKPRRLLFDPLEQRQLLSVSPVQATDTQINNPVSSTLPASVAATNPATWGTGPYSVQTDNQSVATDENGDFVATWTSYDPVMVNGKQATDPTTKAPMVEGNVYARYYTNDVQRITLPSAILNTTANLTSQGYGSFQLVYNGAEQQELSITATNPPFGASADLTGTFGLQFQGKEVTVQFNETDPLQTSALDIQTALRGLNSGVSALADCTVSAVNAHDFMINFGPNELDQSEPLIVADPASYNFSPYDFLPSVTVTGTQIPGQTVSIPVVPNNPQQTATNIQQAFTLAATNYVAKAPGCLASKASR